MFHSVSIMNTAKISTIRYCHSTSCEIHFNTLAHEVLSLSEPGELCSDNTGTLNAGDVGTLDANIAILIAGGFNVIVWIDTADGDHDLAIGVSGNVGCGGCC
jgi:hypothetical protein